MTPRRVTLCFVSLVALSGVLLSWFAASGAMESAVLAANSAPASDREELPRPIGPRLVRVSGLASANTIVRAPITSVLSADSAALLAEQVALQALADKTELRLAPEQWSAFAAVTLHHQAVRQAYEAEIATVTHQERERGRYRVEIPIYPAAGDALRAGFYRDLRAALGEATAAEIAGQLGGRLESHFAGFGVGVQTLEFVAAAGADESDYVVTRTSVFWNGVDSTERLTRRRETHFPKIEDPAGEQWAPFLSLLAPTAVANAGS